MQKQPKRQKPIPRNVNNIVAYRGAWRYLKKKVTNCEYRMKYKESLVVAFGDAYCANKKTNAGVRLPTANSSKAVL